MFYKIKDKKRNHGYEFNYLIHTCLKEDNPKFYDKNFKPNINFIDEDEAPKLRSDQIYSNNILSFFAEKAYLIKSDDSYNLIMYNEDCGMWSFNPKIHKKIIEKYSHVLFPNIYEKDHKRSFISIYNSAYELFEAKCQMMAAAQWFEDNSQIGYLLFKNGVLDMKNRIIKPFSPHYKFTKGINRDYNVNIDYNDGINKIFTKIFDKQFTDTIKRDYYIEKISRGIAGEYQDREFLFNIGETSCGKGILTTFLNIAFEAYINTFNGEELIGKSSSSGDTARDFSFIADMYDCRIGISNELDLKVDEKKREVKGIICNLMKRLTGGGDKFRVRKLYKDPIEVINKCMPMLMVNDLPQTIGVDDAYITRANYITYDRSSKIDIDEDNEIYFKADETIKDFIRDYYIVDSFIYLLCTKYSNSCNEKMKRPASVISITKEMSGYNESGNSSYFKENFNITNDTEIKTWIKTEKNDKGICLVHWDKIANNFIECNELYSLYLKAGYTSSKVAMGKKLAAIGIISSVKKIDGRSVNVYIGIRNI